MAPTAEPNYSAWRARFLWAAAKVFVVPPLVTVLAIRSLPIPLSPSWAVLAIPAYISVYSYIDTRIQEHKAAQMGAKLIPRIVGKWPGNLDILLLLVRSMKTRYAAVGFRDLLEKAGATTVNTRVLWADSIVTFDEGIMKYVLATGFPLFDKGLFQKERFESLFGNGIFNRDGEVWKMHRAMTRPFFIKDRISDFEIFSRHANTVTSILSGISTSAVPVVDVQDLVARFTLDAATEFLFGKCLNTLEMKLPEAGKAGLGPKGSKVDDEFGSFQYSFEAAQNQLSFRSRTVRFWPLVEFFGDKIKPHRDVINQYIDPLVDAAMERQAKAKKEGLTLDIEDSTLLDLLVHSTDDRSLIRDELLNILLAGRDTTAALLSFTIYFLALHPHVSDKLREEIVRHCGTGQPTYEVLKELKYMRAVLNETLRLFPPVPINNRSSGPAPVTLPSETGPLYMPANTPILYSPLWMQRRTDLWGEDAEEFDPERWLDPVKVAKYTSNPFSFIPFNAGPRICLGQNFAYNEASFFLTCLLPRFSFELAPEYQPGGSLPPEEWKKGKGRETYEKVWPGSSVTMYVKGGLWMKAKTVES